MQTWKAVSDKEEICETGLLRVTVSGHGIHRGQYRKPVILSGEYYYRFNDSVTGKPRWRKVVDLLDEFFPGHGMVIDAYWYELIRKLVAKHNLLFQMQYAINFDKNERERRKRKRDKNVKKSARQKKRESLTADITDVFQNDEYLY